MNDWKESDWFNLWLALAKKKLGEKTTLTVNRPASSAGCDTPDVIPAAEWEVTE